MRLEGQVYTAVQIVRFRDRYRDDPDNAERLLLYMAKFYYFTAIKYLVEVLLERGIDLAGAGKHG